MATQELMFLLVNPLRVYLSFLLFIFSITGKFVRGKIMQSRNWRLFVKVDSSVRNDQHCICDIVYIAAVKRDRWPLVLPPPLKKSAKNVGWQFEKKACLQVSLSNFLGRWVVFFNLLEPSFSITVGVSSTS